LSEKTVILAHDFIDSIALKQRPKHCVAVKEMSNNTIVPSQGRLTFPISSPPLPGKIALEEYTSSSIFNATITNPGDSSTGELQYDYASYVEDVKCRLNLSSMAERVAQMNAAGLAITVISLTMPSIEGIFSATEAVQAA
jgi:gamma-resorcylate decarboxylase